MSTIAFVLALLRNLNHYFTCMSTGCEILERFSSLTESKPPINQIRKPESVDVNEPVKLNQVPFRANVDATVHVSLDSASITRLALGLLTAT